MNKWEEGANDVKALKNQRGKGKIIKRGGGNLCKEGEKMKNNKQGTSFIREMSTGGPRILWFLVPKSNHEMRGSWILRTVFSVKPQNGSQKNIKSTLWAFFHEILILFSLLK